MMDSRVKEFIEKYINLIENNKWEESYDALKEIYANKKVISEFTEAMLDAGINPLDYIDYVPRCYLFASDITDITIPSNVTTIEEEAFRNCLQLKKVNILGNITIINDGAFEDCCSLESINVPNSLLRLEDWSFSGCAELKNITLSDKLTTIPWCAFLACSSLEEITIPSSIEHIYSQAFKYCESLKTIHLPSTKVEIGLNAFQNCDKLIHIIFDNTIDKFKEYYLIDGEWDRWLRIDFIIHCTDGDYQVTV